MLSANPEQRPNLEEISHECSAMGHSQFSASKSISKSASKSISHSNYVDASSSNSMLKNSVNRVRIFSDLDFIQVSGNIHPDVVQELHAIKSKIDKSHASGCRRYQDGSVYYG